MKIVTLDQVQAAVFRPSDAALIMLLHPEMRWRAAAWLNALQGAKRPVEISCTVRTMQEQAVDYAVGRLQRTDGSWYETHLNPVITHAQPGQSWHQYALALDFFLVTPAGKASWDTGADYDRDGQPDWTEVGEAAESFGLSWGMRWPKGKTDGDHLEFHPGLDLDAAWTLSQGCKAPIPDDYFEVMA